MTSARRRITVRLALQLAALAVASSGLTACVTWRNEPVPASGAASAPGLPSRVRVTPRGRAAVTVWDPRIVQDSVVGAARADRDAPRVAIALADIEGWEARRPDAGRSALLAVTIVGASIGLLALVLGGADS